MAHIPTEEEIKAIQDKNDQDIADKTADQATQGKSFNIPADGHGPGVVPEEVWKNLPGKEEQNNG
jgi:hypothetical protein